MKRIIALWLAALMLAAQPIQAAVCVGFGQSAGGPYEITFVDKTADSSASATSTLTCGVPTGSAAGDLIIAAVMHDAAGTTITPPSGDWTQIQSNATGGGNFTAAVYYRVLPESLPADYTFGVSGGASIYKLLSCSTFHKAGGTWQVDESTKDDPGSGTATAITTSSIAGVASGVLYAAFVNDNNSTAVTTPTDMTAINYLSNSTSTSIADFYQQVSATAYTKTATWTATADQLAAFQIVFSAQ